MLDPDWKALFEIYACCCLTKNHFVTVINLPCLYDYLSLSVSFFLKHIKGLGL